MTARQVRIVEVLLDRHGRTYASEAGISLGKGTPAPLFQLLCLSILLSARIRADAAVGAARALFENGLTTVDKMAEAGWDRRTRILNQAGYARYDESTSRMLGDTCSILLDRYGGDLRNLREQAERNAEGERELLKEFKGIGDVGGNIFFREIQGLWDEVYPFADDPLLEVAADLDLGGSARDLTGLVGRSDFPVLASALVRCGLAGDADEILAEATS